MVLFLREPADAVFHDDDRAIHDDAEVECAEAADQAAPWTYLQGVLTAGTVADSAQRLCYTLAERQLFAQACPAYVPTP